MNNITANAIRSIKAPEPDSSKISTTDAILKVLDDIEAKLAEPGITQKIVAETLGIEQRSFSVHLARARTKRQKQQMAVSHE